MAVLLKPKAIHLSKNVTEKLIPNALFSIDFFQNFSFYVFTVTFKILH